MKFPFVKGRLINHCFFIDPVLVKDPSDFLMRSGVGQSLIKEGLDNITRCCSWYGIVQCVPANLFERHLIYDRERRLPTTHF
jgi:hypothetical protein